MSGDATLGRPVLPPGAEGGCEAAHRSAGRGFVGLGGLLVCLAPVVAVVGRPAGDWVFGLALAVIVIGVAVIAAWATAHVSRHQLGR